MGPTPSRRNFSPAAINSGVFRHIRLCAEIGLGLRFCWSSEEILEHESVLYQPSQRLSGDKLRAIQKVYRSEDGQC